MTNLYIFWGQFTRKAKRERITQSSLPYESQTWTPHSKSKLIKNFVTKKNSLNKSKMKEQKKNRIYHLWMPFSLLSFFRSVIVVASMHVDRIQLKMEEQKKRRIPERALRIHTYIHQQMFVQHTHMHEYKKKNLSCWEAREHCSRTYGTLFMYLYIWMWDRIKKAILWPCPMLRHAILYT